MKQVIISLVFVVAMSCNAFGEGSSISIEGGGGGAIGGNSLVFNSFSSQLNVDIGYSVGITALVIGDDIGSPSPVGSGFAVVRKEFKK